MDRQSVYEQAINLHYANRYLKFIEMFAGSGNVRHHILPQSEWPEFSDLKENTWNEVLLSDRAHFVAHWLLWKAVGKGQMHAFWMMKHRNNESINSKTYQKLKEEQAIANADPNRMEVVAKNISKTRKSFEWKESNTFKCEVCDKEIIGKGNLKQHQQSHEGKTKRKGQRPHYKYQQVGKKVSEALTGKKQTKEANEKRSIKQKGIKRPHYQKPNPIGCGCGRLISPSNFERHKEKCNVA